MSEYTTTLGRTLTPLTKIDYAECSIGNAIADSMLLGQWADDAKIAFINNGGIRSGFREGEITGKNYILFNFFNYPSRFLKRKS
jgi:2',3'-cyclic-nucleotide 2'-phosphodiesterase (5'-nucleotidase family)